MAGAFAIRAADPSGLDGGTTFGTFGLATLCAGLIGGGMFGPAAWIARTDRAWLAVIVGFAVTAVVVGAFVVGLGFGVTAAAGDGEPNRALETAMALAFFTVVLGVPTLGWFLLPVTLAAAAVWALLMAVLHPPS